MSDEPEEADVPPVERVEVSEDALRQYEREDDFNELSVKLMIEFGSWAYIAASILPGDTKRWNRNQAVVGGLVVRFYKLISALLDQTCQHRREITFVLARLAFECVVNIRYLLLKNSDDVYQAYVAHSLRHERRLMERIEGNIAARSSIVLPIEERMLRSIGRAFEISGLRVDQVTRDVMRPWSNVDLFQRSDAVGLGHAYLYVFAGPSHAVHGNWQDLLEYHLEDGDGGFTPSLDWHHPRPQMLFAIGLLGIEMIKEYISHVTDGGGDEIAEHLDDLSERLRLVNHIHEAFLTSRQIKDTEQNKSS